MIRYAPTETEAPPRHRPAGNYDRLSRIYDLVAGRWEERVKREALNLLDASSGERVLDVGCGTGSELAALARRSSIQGPIWGLDLSAGMLRVARRRLARLRLLDRVALIRADALSLPLNPASLDACLVCFTLELFPEGLMPAVLGGIRRVLRPGGRLCAVALSRAGGPSLRRRLYEWANQQVPALLDCRPIFARPALQRAGFIVREWRLTSVGGLPVEIALAQVE